MSSRADLTQTIRPSTTGSLRGVLFDVVEICEPKLIMLCTTAAGAGFLASEIPASVGELLALMLCVALGSAAASALNHLFDSDIDRAMSRTRHRPLASNRLDADLVLRSAFGVGAIAVILQAVTGNALAAAMLAGAQVLYVGLYTRWLKRRSAAAIFVAGVAQALPILVGNAAAAGRIDPLPVFLFAAVVLWTPVHSWPICLITRSDYVSARVPAMSVSAGYRSTRLQILLLAIATVVASVLPWLLHLTGLIYGVCSISAGAGLIYMAAKCAVSHRTIRSKMSEERKLCGYSFCYLFLIFGSLALDRQLMM